MSNLIESIKIKAKLLQKAKLKTIPDFRLKDAYEILAKSAGFPSWREWKMILDEHQIYAPPGAAMWHVWYADYEQARVHLQQNSGMYLVPFQKHFFVCDNHYIGSLGIVIDDIDLLKVGNNWVEPRDMAAWERLLIKIKKKKT